MRDSLDVSTFDKTEISPLIPPPPIQRTRVKQPSDWCHKCWYRFTCCSKWTCIFITFLVIVAILIIVRSVLPFGWPWWIPSLKYEVTDPHIILIVADDIGWNDLGYAGAEFPTDSMDKLREFGVSLERVYVHNDGAASRSALLTGVPAHALGLQNGIGTGSTAHLPAEARTLPELLKGERGYATYAIGRWGLGYSKWEYTPTERGFDSFFGYHGRYIDYWHYTSSITSDEKETRMGYDLWRNKKVYKETDMKYATKLFDDEVGQVISDHVSGDNPDQPMFLYYAPPNAHTPIEYNYEYSTCEASKDTAEDSTLIRYKYCNLVQELDTSIGHLVNLLEEHDIWDRTVLLITSDNGGLMCYNVGSMSSCSGSLNSPLRAGKNTLFEGGLRVRSVLSGGYIPESVKGTTNNDYIHATDIFASLATAGNVDYSTLYSENEKIEYGITGLPFWNKLMTDHGTSANTDTDDSDDTESDVDDGADTDSGASGGERLFAYTDSYTDSPVFTDRLTEPLLVEYVLDDRNNYVVRAAVLYNDYKFIIQPNECYDGWWDSPTQGTDEIPDQSKGSAYMPEPFGDTSVNTDADTGEDVDNSDTDVDSLDVAPHNEYLFKIDEDPYETNNLRESDDCDECQDALKVIKDYLSDYAQMDEYKYQNPQDVAYKEASNPSNFGNVWYPFEEHFH